MSNSVFASKSPSTLIFTILTGLYVLFAVVGCEEKPEAVPGDPQNTLITLKIKNATPLFNNPNYNDALIKVNCKMTDNRTNNGTEVDPYSIVSIVNIGKVVTWEVKVEGPAAEEYDAKILLIEEKPESTDNFFDAVILPPNAMGQVKRNANSNASVGNYYTYSLFFSLTKGTDTRYYSIDPKLRGNN